MAGNEPIRLECFTPAWPVLDPRRRKKKYCQQWCLVFAGHVSGADASILNNLGPSVCCCHLCTCVVNLGCLWCRCEAPEWRETAEGGDWWSQDTAWEQAPQYWWLFTCATSFPSK